MLLLVTDVDDDDLLTSVRNDAEPRSVAWVRAGAVMWFDGTLWRMTQGVHDHLSAHGLELDDTGLAGLLDLYHFDHPEPPDELLGNLRVTQLTDHLGVQQPARPSRFDDAYAAILPEVEQSTEEMDMEHRTVSLQDADGWYLDFEPGRVVSGHVHISDSRVLATDVAQAVELAHRFMIGDLDWVRRRLWRTPEETSDYLS